MSNRILLYSLLLTLGFSTSQCSSLQNLSTSNNRNLPRSTGTNNSSTSQLRKNVADYALQQKGTRYTYAGRAPRTGFDCSGFTYYVFDAFDVPLTPVSRVQENEGKRVNLDDAQTGDLIFFRKNKTGAVFHVALVVRQSPGELVVVHSTSSRGVMMENIYSSSYWRTKIMSARDVISK